MLADVASSTEAMTADTGGAQSGLVVADYNILVAERSYQTVFGRSGDAAGLQFHADNLSNGALTEKQLSATFVNSAEFTQLYGSQSDADFVASLYGNAFGRGADAEGLAFWSGFLGNGGSRAQVVQAFQDAPEAQDILSQLAETGISLQQDLVLA
jgi:hypothetical protein